MFENWTIDDAFIIKDAIIDSDTIQGIDKLVFKKCKGDTEKIQKLVKKYKDATFFEKLIIVE